MYFFTADFHFGSSDIIEREARPFKDMKEMEDVIVNNINSEASKDDTLFVLGDWINYSTIYHSDISVFEVCRRINPSPTSAGSVKNFGIGPTPFDASRQINTLHSILPKKSVFVQCADGFFTF